MRGRILLCLFFILLFQAEYVPAQITSQPNYVTVHNWQKKFVQYQQDFLDFAKGDEYQPSADLNQVAATTGDDLNSVGVLLEIYEVISCPQDRTPVREVIQRELTFYIKQVNIEIETANLDIANTQKPGVAAEASRMRDDLREVHVLFDSIKLR
jgi:hypothetical protein